MTILAVDIGNTNIVYAVNESDKWVCKNREKTRSYGSFNVLSETVGGRKIDKAVISSVVPNLVDKMCESIKKICNITPLIISRNIKTGLTNIPMDLGSDIICNLIKAHNLFPNDYVMVADFGTAFTTETVSPEGKVMGITIGPGMMTSVKALFSNTAQIPQIRLEIPETVLGLDTVTSVRAGVIYGFTGQLNALVAQVEKEIKHHVKLIVTGGFSVYVKPFLDHVDIIDTYHTLEGEKLACLMN